MLSRLIAFALSQRLFMLVVTALLVLAGALALRTLPIDAFPDISTTQVKIIMKAPGMTPEEVEARITAPIEQELLGIPGQTILRSRSKYAIADITIDFEDGTDIYWARQQVSERLAGIIPNLPPTVSGGLAPISTPLSDMFMFTVEGPLSLEQKRTLLDWTVRPQLRGIPGVADVNSLGGYVKSFDVVVDQTALAARGLSLSDVEEALRQNNRNDGAGRLSDNEEALLVRSEGSIRTLDDVRAIVVTMRGTVPIRVGDIATVRVGALTRYGLVNQNGIGEAVEGLVIGLRGANAQQIVRQVRARLAQIEKTLPPGTSLVPFYDRGRLIERAVSTVTHALGEAIVLVLILLFLFLGQLRAALVVALILPLSALATFLAMRLAGLSANLMSLGGLAIAIGLLVDAAVVVVENVEAHGQAGRGASRLHQIYRATQEVAVPVAAGIAIIIIVFLPLLSLQGLEGKLFAPVALTIVFALASSLLLSLMVIPVLASYLLSTAHHEPPRFVRWLEAGYARALGWTLSHERVVYGSALAGLATAVALFFVLGKSFLPTMDEGDVVLQLEKIPSVNLVQSSEIDRAIQRRILERVPEVAKIVARVGADELGLDPMGVNETDSFLALKPREAWGVRDKSSIVEQIRRVGEEFGGINFSFTQPIDMRVSELISGVRGDLAVKIYGPDLGELDRLAQEIGAALRKIPGSEDVIAVANQGVQYLQVEMDRTAVGRAGVSVESLQNDLRALVEGRTVGTVLEEGRRLPLVLRGSHSLQMSPELFRQLRVPLSDGGTAVPLSQLAKLVVREGPLKVERENAARMAVVRANVHGRDLVGFVKEAQALIGSTVKLPAAYRLSWGGQFESQQRTAARLAVVVPLALGLIYLLLFATLGSLRQALLVFVNIPFAMIGGVFALAISGEYLSVPASVGFIALMGIAVLNGLVMISHFNQLSARQPDVRQVVLAGARRRLRPVLMTASIAAFGLVPLLFASGPGSEIQRPLAIVVIGGLVSSTLLTLALLPSLFTRFGRGQS
ncbi:MAG TPA: CusA/CzcA family heavy metal efflux RND transporter [Steroidobacteraceae bacterium]|nr:CusA/CzcA family heavy metal efflux RND transporter [Steroidobacteraceae bacterium]